MTTVYLAWASSAGTTLEKHASDAPVSLLVAYPVLKQFLRLRERYNVDRWCLDSGAFSAFHSGVVIDLAEYTEDCKSVLSLPTSPATEVFGLDVIDDCRAGQKNLEYMWREGVPAIPTWHAGEPLDILDWAAQSSDKIAVSGSGTPGMKPRPLNWYMDLAFSRVWPKKIHGFAMASKRMLDRYPFHSVDASSWIYAPAAMGHWCGFTGRQIRLSARGVKDFWVEVEEHQRRERHARSRWKRELQEING